MMDGFVDNLNEDEVERESLLAKPTCFIIFGKPGVGKSTLAKKIAESWKCIIVDDTDLLNVQVQSNTKEGKQLLSEGSLPDDVIMELILAKLNSPEVQHYGYVLSCLPLLSEDCGTINDQIELIKNLKLTPDFIINIQCEDKDLIQRLSNLKPTPEEMNDEKKEENDENMEVEEEQAEGEELPNDIAEQMAWKPEYLPEKASIRIKTYNDVMLGPLENYMKGHHQLYLLELDGINTPEELLSSVLSHLGAMAIKRVSVPVLLDPDVYGKEPADGDMEDLLQTMSHSRTAALGFKWRRSRWGAICPVALMEGRMIPGQLDFSVGFQDKLYILSSQEAYEKFLTNPRRYLLSPMPKAPCKVSIIGPPQSGKSTICKIIAQHYNAVVIDLEELLQKAATQDTTEKMGVEMEQDDEQHTEDHSEVQAIVSSALEDPKIPSTDDSEYCAELLQERIKEIDEANSSAQEQTGWVLDNFPNKFSHMVALEQAGILPDMIFCLRDSDRLDAEDEEEMNENKLQLQQFMEEWEQMESALSVPHCVLEIARKSPEKLLEEMLQQMQKPFQHVPLEMSESDLHREAASYEAAAEREAAVEDSNDSYAAEEIEGEQIVKRLLGDTHHFCPVALKNHDVLWPCTDKIVAMYREKIFYFSSEEARESFLQNPEPFVAQTEPLKPPALRILLLGARGSGKTTHGQWLAKQLGLLHIQFREMLQSIIVAKTNKRVPYPDEVGSSNDNSDELEARIRKAKGELEKESDSPLAEVENTEEVEMTDLEIAIKEYLSGETSQDSKILEVLVAQYWEQEPYRSTGFILEGFPNDPDEIEDMLQRHFYPDVVVILQVDYDAVQTRLLPKFMDKWHESRNHRQEQLTLLQDLLKKKQSEYEETEEDDEDLEDEETEDAATERLGMEIENCFSKDENTLFNIASLMEEQNIPKLEINASRKLQITQPKLLQKIQPLLTNRESLFQKCLPISSSIAHKLLISSYKFHSAFGLYDPIKMYKERDLIQPLQWPIDATFPLVFNQYIYFFSSEDNRNTFMLNPLMYLRQPRPVTSLPIKIAIIGPPKSGKTTVAKMLAQKYGLVCLSIGKAIDTVINTQQQTELAAQIKAHSSDGITLPDDLAIKCLVALMSSGCGTQGYVLDGFPMNENQAKLMTSLSIIPMIVFELDLDMDEIEKRSNVDKINPNSPDSSSNDSCDPAYKNEWVQVRHYFQQEYQNWILLDGMKSKWWIYSHIIKEVSINMEYIKRTQHGQAASVKRKSISPEVLKSRLGEFSQYCPVCLALHHHLLDCSETAALTYAAEYKTLYYKMCGEHHLEEFLSTPDQFVSPGCPRTLPQADMLPRKLTETEARDGFSRQTELKGFCPVTYLDGKGSFEALVRGKLEYAVEYRERLYVFETKQKQDKFLRVPETYWDQILPDNARLPVEPIPLTSLPAAEYLKQGLAKPLIKAMTATGILRPKYSSLSLKTSALLHIAVQFKVLNPKGTEYTQQKYKRKLERFEAGVAHLRREFHYENWAQASKGTRVDFEFRLKRFLANDMQ